MSLHRFCVYVSASRNAVAHLDEQDTILDMFYKSDGSPVPKNLWPEFKPNEKFFSVTIPK